MKTCLLRTLACLASAVVPAGLHGQELITNGNFEDPTLAAWQVSGSAGTSVTTVTETSPYVTRYPGGTKSARLQDDDVNFETPSLGQSFPGQAAIDFTFDFKAPATAPGSSWYVIWKGDVDTTAFFFTIGGQDGSSFSLNQTPVGSLEANTWYHVEGTANAPAQSVTGFVLNSHGVRSTFSGGFPFGVASVLNGVSVTDGDQAQNGTLLVDKISAIPVATVVEPASLAIAATADQKVTVSWNTADYTLQGSSTIGTGAQWINIPTSGQSYTTSSDQPRQFFRLVSK